MKIDLNFNGNSYKVNEEKKSKEKAEKFEVQVEPGKITYVQLVFETGLFINNIYCEEVTENTATQKISNMEEDTKCL